MDIYKMTDTELFEFTTPILEQLVEAGNAQDWEAFSKHLIASGRTAEAKENVENQWKHSPALSSYKKEFEFLGAIRKSDHIATIWKMFNYETTDEILGVLCLQYEGDEVKVHTYRVF